MLNELSWKVTKCYNILVIFYSLKSKQRLIPWLAFNQIIPTSLLTNRQCFLIFQDVTSVQIRKELLYFVNVFTYRYMYSMDALGVTEFCITLSVLSCKGVAYGRNICNIYTNIYGLRSCNFLIISSLSVFFPHLP